MKKSRHILFTIALVSTWMILPEVSLACERCFGAGSDSPIVTAIGISMLALLAVIGAVFTGIISFFNQAHNRAQSMTGNGDEDRQTHRTREI